MTDIPWVTMEINPTRQTVILTGVNEQEILTLSDGYDGGAELSPVQRAVWVARLRSLADVIESGL